MLVRALLRAMPLQNCAAGFANFGCAHDNTLVDVDEMNG
jgi:hypothetical protein